MAPWRIAFILAAVGFSVGGPMHPRGTNPEMLADPAWVPSHLIFLAGAVALLAGLVLYRRERGLPPRTARWGRLAAWGTLGMVLEMVVHTAAVVDAESAAAGGATPVLYTHLTMSVVLFPLFGVLVSGFVVATARDRSLAHPWAAPLGVIGAFTFGISPPLAITVGVGFFPLILALALWLVLAGVWPARSPAPVPGTA